MKDISEAAMREPTPDELVEATEVLDFIVAKPAKFRARFLAYFLREAEETGRQKEREKYVRSMNQFGAGQINSGINQLGKRKVDD